MRRRCVVLAWVVVVAAALIATISSASVSSALALPQVARSYDLTIHYSGVYHDDYTNSGTGEFSFHSMLVFDESREVTVEFPSDGASTASVTPGPASLTASGSITSAATTPGFMPDSCTIKAGSASSVKIGVPYGQANTVGSTTTRLIDVQAPMPIGAAPPNLQLVITGTNNNCAADTLGGTELAPYDFMYPQGGVGGIYDPGGNLSRAQFNDNPGVNIDQLPYSQSYPVDFTETDTISGSDHVTLSAQLTVSAGCSAAVAAADRAPTATRSAGDQCCPPPVLANVWPNGGTFNGAAPLDLLATATGGCKPLTYHWTLVKHNKRLQVTPPRATTSPRGTLSVTAKCPPKPKKLSFSRWFDGCIGPVQYSVYATDASGQRSNVDYATNNWCVPQKKGPDKCTVDVRPDLRKEWQGQANGFRSDALDKAWRNAAGAVADALMSPSIGGKLGFAKDVLDWLQSGDSLYGATRPDKNLADKADAAAAADPPDAATSVIALPGAVAPASVRACARGSGKQAAAAFADCLALEPALAAYAQGQAKTLSLLGALLKSQNRFGTAVRAGQADASALQSAVIAVISRQLADSFVATDQAGLDVARIGRAQGLFPILTRRRIQQTAVGLARLRRLSAAVARAFPGVALKDLTTSLQNALRDSHATRLDLVATFTRSLRDARVMPLAGPVTADGVRAVVSQLSAQRDVSAASDAALGQALDGFVAASGSAAAAQALAAFDRAARQVPGPAGSFLIAAARALGLGG